MNDFNAMLDDVNYSNYENYIPSIIALEVINLIKLINDGIPLENKSPISHLRYLDTFFNTPKSVINVCHRGFGKTSIVEYLIFYLALNNGQFPNYGEARHYVFMSDTMLNGVTKMRNNMEYRYKNSEFLQTFLDANFTLSTYRFKNKDNFEMAVSCYGAATGIRGTRELGIRPQIGFLDDIMSDKTADSPVGLSNLAKVVGGALKYAMHPKHRILWSGTPFNENDPLTNAVQSGSYVVNLFPASEKFPCTKDEFKGVWEDRFPFEVMQDYYEVAKKEGQLDLFNREMQLRIMSAEDRLISDSDIVWYSRNTLIQNINAFNIYITTDFAVSNNSSADYNVICVWAYNSNRDWFLLDGICERQLMDKSIDDLFKYCQQYSPQSVGIEVSGQQAAFIQWIQQQMMERNVWFTLASNNNKGALGIRPDNNIKKYDRFKEVQPQFKLKKIHLPQELRKVSPLVIEAVKELKACSIGKYKGKNDDVLDNFTMLGKLNAFPPSNYGITLNKSNNVWNFTSEFNKEEVNVIDNYIV